MPKEDSDDEDIWDYQPRHRTKQSQHSKDACVVRNDVNSTALKGETERCCFDTSISFHKKLGKYKSVSLNKSCFRVT